MAERKAVTKQMAGRYARASKVEKGRILDELCALTGWTRRHARRALGSAGSPPAARARPSVRIYGPEVLEPLKVVWATLNGPAGKRLAPFMAEVVEVLERSGELEVSGEVRAKLVRVSAATIDRLLAPERARLRVRGRSGTKPGSLLRRQIPIRTFAEWDERLAGFCEVDLVAHDGGDPHGEFAHTLNLTCVKTGWDEMRALPTKAQRWVEEAIDQIRGALPFPLLGLDSDNGSEFINNHLFRYCVGRGITFTRTRPYRKNDNCFVEQKNWPVIRQQVGYARYDTPQELEVLREAVHPPPAVRELLPATDEAALEDPARGDGDQAVRRRGHALPAGPGLSRGLRGVQGPAPGDLRRPEPSSAQARARGLPGQAPRAGSRQGPRGRAREEEGGESPTRPPLAGQLVPGAGLLEDIFGEATGGTHEDILT